MASETSTQKLEIDTHGSLIADSWTVKLDGVDISNQVHKIEIISEAGEIPYIHLTLYADFEFTSGIEGYVVKGLVEHG